VFSGRLPVLRGTSLDNLRLDTRDSGSIGEGTGGRARNHSLAGTLGKPRVVVFNPQGTKELQLVTVRVPPAYPHFNESQTKSN